MPLLTEGGEIRRKKKILGFYEMLSRKLFVGEGREKEGIFSFKLAHFLNSAPLT